MLSHLLSIFYFAILVALSLYGLHRYWILYLYWRYYKKAPPVPEPPAPSEWPLVTIQLPLYNEYYVVERLIEAVCRMDYPRDRMEIQVLDDSTDDTQTLTQQIVAKKKIEGYHIYYLRRPRREGFKAGALAHGLSRSRGEFIAIFDADFLPPKDFLRETIPHFHNPRIGMVQTRWGHINADYSLLTRLQSLFLDGHFFLEHTARNRSGAFINFNGTAGIWRRQSIEDAGGWTADTLTEDLDLSYRAQLKGWQFLFLPELVCPSELPVDIGAFRAQQHRWAKGGIQVAKKLLPRLWRSGFPLHVKIEGTAQLLANCAHVLVLALSLLLFPSQIWRHQMAWPQLVHGLQMFAFLFTSVSIVFFYIVVQRERGTCRGTLCWRDLPALMSLGIGMCMNNSRAVLEAFAGIPTNFHRTPKYNIWQRREAWRHKRYRLTGGLNGVAETMMAGYLFLIISWSFYTAQWVSLPFLTLFLAGYIYVGWLTFKHSAPKQT